MLYSDGWLCGSKFGKSSGYMPIILRAVRSETFHTNPKRLRGNELKPSLTLRVSIPGSREQYNVSMAVPKSPDLLPGTARLSWLASFPAALEWPL